MTIAEIISIVDESKPNQYDTVIKTEWLSEVEGILVDQVFNQAEGVDIEFDSYNYDLDAEKKLLIPDRFSDVYINYLYSKIDYANAEFGRYNNDVAMYQGAFDTFAAWYRRMNMPKQRNIMRM